MPISVGRAPRLTGQTTSQTAMKEITQCMNCAIIYLYPVTYGKAK